MTVCAFETDGSVWVGGSIYVGREECRLTACDLRRVLLAWCMAMSCPLSLDSTCRSSRRCGRVDVSSQRAWRHQKTRASVRLYGRYDTDHRCGSAICANECYAFAPDGCGICQERRTPQAVGMTRQVQKHLGANKTNIRVRV